MIMSIELFDFIFVHTSSECPLRTVTSELCICSPFDSEAIQNNFVNIISFLNILLFLLEREERVLEL